MNRDMTIGSLFDGSGGFPLAGMICGMQPVWASEIEPYPLRVTAARFPCMKQLGDVTKIDGAKIEPVDVITFGSPCQDLSVAGKQAGIRDGARSSLFFEAVRIIKEMRGATDGRYPSFAVWENVPGAFSSNAGADFRAVLEALCGVTEPDVSVPEPPKGKWQKAGCIVGDGYSIAWRTLDAQYFGVPQRRRRIYLVADFAGERAGEILFEREGVRGNPAQSGAERQEAAADAGGSAAGSDDLIYALQGNGIDRDIEQSSFTLNTVDRHGVVFMAGQGAKAHGIGAHENLSPTLKGTASGLNMAPSIACIDCRNHNVRDIIGTLQAKPNGGQSLNFINPVCYDARGNGDGQTAPTLTGDHQNRVTDYTAICCQNTGIGWWNEGNVAQTLRTTVSGDATKANLVASIGNGQLNQISMPEKSNTLDCMHDKQAVLVGGRPPRKYIVRRLTLLECCRLQGFPDWWEDGVEGSDSARYKMWGNGIALPCAVFVLDGIARAMADNEEA